MLCVKNDDELYLHGNYDTQNLTSVMIVLERCDPEKNAKNEATKNIQCVNDTEFKEWASMRYIIILEQQERFIQNKFNEDRLHSSAELKYYPINVDARNDYVNMVTRSRMELNDEYMSFASEYEEEREYYTIDKSSTRCLPYLN